ncbi:MAG: DUF1559 domain-containing protein, partial [Planctomycetaceae bacterium]|nr:DUF1559 domain-containing protein [Planctomycetaceae bacterium]
RVYDDLSDAALPPEQRVPRQIVSVFLCPSGLPTSVVTNTISFSGTRGDLVASGNYMVCYGSGTGRHYDTTFGTNDGVVSKRIYKGLESITDGTSNTLFFSEAIIGDGTKTTSEAPDLATPWTRTATNGSAATSDWSPTWLTGEQGIPGVNATTESWLKTYMTSNTTAYSGLRGFAWVVGEPYATGFCTFSPPNPPYTDWCNNFGMGFMSARSFHTGGVNASYADGSVIFVANSVNGQIFRRMGSINDGGADLPQ